LILVNMTSHIHDLLLSTSHNLGVPPMDGIDGGINLIFIPWRRASARRECDQTPRFWRIKAALTVPLPNNADRGVCLNRISSFEILIFYKYYFLFISILTQCVMLKFELNHGANDTQAA
jgi:hypothetical protein